MSAATAKRPQAMAGVSARRLATIERLATICGLLSCWRRGLPREAGETTQLAPSAASDSQMSMRAICDLLQTADLAFDELSKLEGHDRPALALLFAYCLACTIEAALWNMSCGADKEGIPRADLDVAAMQVHRYVSEAVRWCNDGLHASARVRVTVTVPEGGAA